MKLTDAINLLTTVSSQQKQILTDVQAKIHSLQSSVDSLTATLTAEELTEEQTAVVQSVVDGTNALSTLVPSSIDPATGLPQV